MSKQEGHYPKYPRKTAFGRAWEASKDKQIWDDMKISKNCHPDNCSARYMASTTIYGSRMQCSTVLSMHTKRRPMRALSSGELITRKRRASLCRETFLTCLTPTKNNRGHLSFCLRNERVFKFSLSKTYISNSQICQFQYQSTIYWQIVFSFKNFTNFFLHYFFFFFLVQKETMAIFHFV